MRLVALACVFAVAACGGQGEGVSPPDPSTPPGPADAPAADLAPTDPTAVTLPSTLAPDSGVVVDIDPAFLRRATLSRDGRLYRLDRVGERWEVGGRPADVGAWLARYAPLRADGRVAGLPPDSVVFAPDAQVSFFFDDGSGRVVSFRRRGDSLAVVARPNGPVYRLPPERLDALVPPAETFGRR